MSAILHLICMYCKQVSHRLFKDAFNSFWTNILDKAFLYIGYKIGNRKVH